MDIFALFWPKNSFKKNCVFEGGSTGKKIESETRGENGLTKNRVHELKKDIVILGGGSTEKTTEFQTWGRNGLSPRTKKNLWFWGGAPPYKTTEFFWALWGLNFFRLWKKHSYFRDSNKLVIFGGAPVKQKHPVCSQLSLMFVIFWWRYEEEQSQGYNRRTTCSFTNFSSNKNVLYFVK